MQGAVRPMKSVTTWTNLAGSLWWGKCPASSKISSSAARHRRLGEAAVAEGDHRIVATPDEQGGHSLAR